MKYLLLITLLVCSCRESVVKEFVLLFESLQETPDSSRLKSIENRVAPNLKKELTEAGFAYGASVYLQFFKEEKVLDLYIKYGVNQVYKTYEIAAAPGDLGPESREGDGQSPGLRHFFTSWKPSEQESPPIEVENADDLFQPDLF